MKLKHSISLLLCLSLLFLTITGCATSGADSGDHINHDDCDHTREFLVFESALATFAPDTVMATTAAGALTWADLFIFLHRTVSNLLHSYGNSFDWNDGADTGSSLADLVMDYSTEEALSFLAYLYGFNSLGFSLSADDLRELTEELDELVEMYGGMDELEHSLRENGGFYNFELFEKLYKIEYTIGFLINELYGENASAFPDDRAAAYAEDNGYMMAMHILRLKIEGDNTPFEESEEILAQLELHRDSNDLYNVFFSLMNEHSEDGGLHSNPYGYLFLFHEMVEPFSIASASLKEGEMSGIVETVYGYHIILRVPIDYDDIPFGFANAGIYRTLRQAAALEEFDLLMTSWLEALNVEFTSEYNSIDLAAIFNFE